MRLSTIIRALAGVLAVALLGVILLVAPGAGTAQAAPAAPTACRASVKVPFEAVIGPEETPLSATLIDPTGCVKSARFDLYETSLHKRIGNPFEFFPGQSTVTFTVSEPGTYRLVADNAYNVRHNADVTGLDPSILSSNTLVARMASTVGVQVTHKHHKTYLRAFALYWEPADNSWSELIDLPLKVQRSIDGHWVKVGKTLSNEPFRLKHAGTYRVKVPDTEYIWGTVSASVTRN